MDNISSTQIILGIFYLTGAIALVLAAYSIYLKRFKRNKLKALNTVSLITSRENIFAAKTRFLVVAPEVCHVKVDLLDADEKVIQTLIDQEITNEELPFDFDPTAYEAGKYYLYLNSDNANILRSITIVR
ncbi:hypothetical protein K6119_03975 [Paracrocinitomix mangrovi]|uniref:hypothetical protein n=1 Tax=Paracrocinitomix mangrovi TaxID=2862509 RepID=UPI001C8EE3B7|nr:hypothetical protein [Paracrocinitomix mangrovi]UKN02670.1 hypothetical protein K6119_03975 [Paracrocinitomix mangrovi]